MIESVINIVVVVVVINIVVVPSATWGFSLVFISNTYYVQKLTEPWKTDNVRVAWNINEGTF